MFSGKRLLITGGTGSFGHAVVRRFLDTEIGEIHIFSRDEKKQEDMRLLLNNDKLKFIIGDVRNYDSVLQALREIDYVFHAAALKQVPSCEFYPLEAVRTNVLGTENVLNAAVASGVKRLIVLSTDKAVYPINAMGMSKALAEKIMIAKARMVSRDATVFCATRYGNVMASRGSVIPLFLQQLLAGAPLTVTDPNMTRFLMSLEESVELVIHAFSVGVSGDTFVQKAPAATVGTLATALRELLNRGNSIELIGTRHGEKLYETLVSREEMARSEISDGYFRIPLDARDLNYRKYFVEGERRISELEDYTSHNAERLQVSEVKTILAKLPLVREAGNA